MSEGKKRRPRMALVKSISLANIDRVLNHWLPGGKRVDKGKEYSAPNPTRTDKTPGSFKVNLSKGTWADFASGDSGGDLIDLVAYLDRCSLANAAGALADLLNIDADDSAAAKPSAKPKSRVAEEAWTPVVPVPEEALERRPVAHYQHGKPSAMWTYRDAQGRVLMFVCRYDARPADTGKRKKTFAPLTWCRSEKTGAYDWRYQGLPKPRPILNQDKLSAQPDAPAVVCEGEKAADAAASLFPEHVATCWPNGSGQWGMADFGALKGRDVILWPDNDEPGTSCMAALADHLRELGVARLRLIALAALSQTPAVVGGKPALKPGGDWPEGADAADALGNGWTAAHMASLVASGELFAQALPVATGKAQPSSAGAGSEEPAAPRYQVRDEGVFYVGDDGETRLICSKLEILALTRDAHGKGWGLLLELTDPDGQIKRAYIPARAMAGDFGKEVVGLLVDMGLVLAPHRPVRHSRNDLQSYLQAFQGSERVLLVPCLGWHGEAFLLPDRQVGTSRERLFFYEGAGSTLPPISQKGSLEHWRSQIAALCVGNHRLAFCVSIALAGSLLRLLGYESGGAHLYGDSSAGKTTHLLVAASVWGSPRFKHTWKATDNALEGMAAAHSDGLLILDEIGMCEPRIIGETIYMLSNEAGKVRSNERGSNRPVQEWKLLFLSTGEKTLAQHMAEAGKELKAGMSVRMLEIPADAGKGLGLFEDIHSFASPTLFSDTLVSRSARCYGSAGPAFLEALTAQTLPVLAGVLRKEVEHFVAKALPANASGQAHRAAARFGVVAVAGELASEWGITGWPAGFATQSARVCLDAWLGARGGAGNLEGDKIVAHLRLIVERFGESRFTRWENIEAKVDDHAPRTADRLGFRRTVTHGLGDERYTEITFYFLSTSWSQEVFKGHNIANVNRELTRRGILIPGRDRASQSVNLPGMPKARTYVVDNTRLMADPEASEEAA